MTDIFQAGIATVPASGEIGEETHEGTDGSPEHADGAVHATKEQADAAEESGEDRPPQR